LQEDSYYPFGMTMNGLNYLSGSKSYEKNKYLYNGKELNDEFGLDWYSYGSREYDAQLGRFHVIDNYSEKYYSMTPYQYGGNNPVLFIDVNGDSISVAERYRNQFNSALESAFGKKASNFSYTSSGKLKYNGTKKDFKGDERKVFKGLSKVMGEETNTNVIYGASTQITMNDGTTQTVNASQGGGAFTVLASENNVSENTILVDPNANTSATVFAVTSAYYMTPIDPANGARFQSTTITTNTNNLTFHEIGHVVYDGQSQNKVIDYDNLTRGIYKSTSNVPIKAPGYDKGASGYTKRIYTNSPMRNRPYDETHNSTIK